MEARGNRDHSKSWHGFTCVILTTLAVGKYSCYLHVTGKVRPGAGEELAHILTASKERRQSWSPAQCPTTALFRASPSSAATPTGTNQGWLQGRGGLCTMVRRLSMGKVSWRAFWAGQWSAETRTWPVGGIRRGPGGAGSPVCILLRTPSWRAQKVGYECGGTIRSHLRRWLYSK